MEDELKQLLALCEYDKKIFNLRKSNKDLPLKIDALNGEINAAKQKLESLNQEIEACEKKITDSRTFAEEEKKNLEESNTRLENISTNKEYDAIHSEIAAHKKNIEESQANVLHYQQTLENLKQDQEEVGNHYQSILEANSPELKKLTEELNSLEDRISEVKSKAIGPRSKVSKKVISIYDRIIKRRKSPFIIATLDWNRNVCEICNRTQPPQKINELSRMNSIHTCETCGSLLIWNEETSEETVK